MFEMNPMRGIDTFTVECDSGKRYQVDVLKVGGYKDPHLVIRDHSLTISMIDPTTFKIVETDEVCRKII